jgi:hypothetical protein
MKRLSYVKLSPFRAKRLGIHSVNPPLRLVAAALTSKVRLIAFGIFFVGLLPVTKK